MQINLDLPKTDLKCITFYVGAQTNFHKTARILLCSDVWTWHSMLTPSFYNFAQSPKFSCRLYWRFQTKCQRLSLKFGIGKQHAKIKANAPGNTRFIWRILSSEHWYLFSEWQSWAGSRQWHSSIILPSIQATSKPWIVSPYPDPQHTFLTYLSLQTNTILITSWFNPKIIDFG